MHLLNNPTEILGDDKGWVKGIECIKMELGDPDESGRRSPIPIKGSEYVLDIDMVVMQIFKKIQVGQLIDLLVFAFIPISGKMLSKIAVVNFSSQ